MQDRCRDNDITNDCRSSSNFVINRNFVFFRFSSVENQRFLSCKKLFTLPFACEKILAEVPVRIDTHSIDIFNLASFKIRVYGHMIRDWNIFVKTFAFYTS